MRRRETLESVSVGSFDTSFGYSKGNDTYRCVGQLFVEQTGTGDDRRSGGQYIVHQQNMPACQAFGSAQSEGLFYIVPSFGVRFMGLAGIAAGAYEGAGIDIGMQVTGDAAGYVFGLVVSAGEEFASVKRYGNNDLHTGVKTATGQFAAEPLSHVECRTPFAVVFESVDHAPKTAVMYKEEKRRSVHELDLSPKFSGHRIVRGFPVFRQRCFVTTACAYQFVPFGKDIAACRTYGWEKE